MTLKFALALGAVLLLVVDLDARPREIVQLDLGARPNTDSCVATDINRKGQIVGYCVFQVLRTHAFLWDKGVMTEVAPVDGTAILGSFATGINNRGQVVGTIHTPRGFRAFLWENGTTTELDTLGGDSSHAEDINNRGQVVGYASTASGQTHAFLWDEGVMTDLAPTLAFSQALSINRHGQIVGSAAMPDGSRAVLWHKDTMYELVSLAESSPSHAAAINDRGVIAGISDSRPVIWEEGEVRQLPIPTGATSVGVLDINNRDQVVGRAGTFGTGQGAVWDRETVTVLGVSEVGVFTTLYAVNDRGAIVGSELRLPPPGAVFGASASALLWTSRPRPIESLTQ